MILRWANKNKFVGCGIFMLMIAYFSAWSADDWAGNAPLVDPLSTVNLATGMMNFNLPIATVHGFDGHDFPIKLSYSAGIKTDAEASPVGLGFNLAVGGIARHVVLVPDDETNAFDIPMNANTCDPVHAEKWWDEFLNKPHWHFPFITDCPLGGGYYADPIVVITFPSAGSGTTRYNYEQYNRGFFYSGKGGTSGLGDFFDMPDRYIVNTPFLDGELVYSYTDATTNDHYFKLKRTTKSGQSCTNVTACLTNNKNIFKITLGDGTRLIFDVADKGRNETIIEANENETPPPCHYSHYLGGQTYTRYWHLSRVLFNDFVGSDEDDASTAIYGHWIEFKYVSCSIPDEMVQSLRVNQISECATSFANQYYSQINYLSSILTPNESALFNYSFDRLDNIKACNPPEIRPNFAAMLQPRLNSLEIKDSKGRLSSKVEFTTDYYLRPGTAYAAPNPFINANTFYYTGSAAGGYEKHTEPLTLNNPNKASLTLRSIVKKDYNLLNPAKVVFHYNAATNYTVQDGEGKVPVGNEVGTLPCHIESRDWWGYYCDAGVTSGQPILHNDFNVGGDSVKAAKTDAWSLAEMVLPNGLSLHWNYESNRYRINGALKHGDGIRVKKLTADPGVGGAGKSYNFFYSNMPTPGNFDGLTECSGVTQVEPYPMVSLKFDPRGSNYITALTGGNYITPQVTYGRVVIVPNYNEVSGATPNGYTAYDFTSDCPFNGRNGSVDMSWLRGWITNVIDYNSNNKVVHNHHYSYSHIPFYFAPYGVRDGFGAPMNQLWNWANLSAPMFEASEDMLSYAQTLLTGEEDTRDGVTKRTSYTYAPQIEPASKDRLTAWVGERVLNLDVFLNPWISPEALKEHLTAISVKMCKGFGDASKDDAVIVFTTADWAGGLFTGTSFPGESNMYVTVLRDIDWRYGPTLYCDFPNVLNPGQMKEQYYHKIFSKPFLVSGQLPGTFDARDISVTDHGGGNIDITIETYMDQGFAGNKVKYGINTIELKNVHWDPSDNNRLKFNGTIGPQSFLYADAIYLPPGDIYTAIGPRLGIDYSFHRWTEKKYYDANIQFQNFRDLAGARVILKAPSSEVQFCDLDGLPNKITEESSKGNVLGEKWKITENEPAYWFWDDMKNKNMLSQIARTTISQMTIQSPSNVVSPVKCQTIVWDKIWYPEFKVYKPIGTYEWNVPDDFYEGIPIKALQLFNPASIDLSMVNNGPDPQDWSFKQGNTVFNRFGQPMQTILPLPNNRRLKNQTIYDAQYRLPIATIKNAGGDAAMYSCTYETTDYPQYFDKDNDWEKGTVRSGGVSELVNSPVHFGAYSLHLKAGEGPNKIVPIDKRKDYILSAWIKDGPGSTGPATIGVKIYSDDGNGWYHLQGILSKSLISNADISKTEWRYIECPIKTSTLSSILYAGESFNDTKYFKIFLSTGGQPSDEIYVDDIRFYPSQALSTCNFYDDRTPNISLTVDPNGNPSDKAAYDGYGRLVNVFKIADKKKSCSDPSNLIPKKILNYYLNAPSTP